MRGSGVPIRPKCRGGAGREARSQKVLGALLQHKLRLCHAATACQRLAGSAKVVCCRGRSGMGSSRRSCVAVPASGRSSHAGAVPDLTHEFSSLPRPQQRFSAAARRKEQVCSRRWHVKEVDRAPQQRPHVRRCGSCTAMGVAALTASSAAVSIAAASGWAASLARGRFT